MYSLNTIKRINRDAVKRRSAPETETSRHCSYAGDVEKGLVLHSAKRRSTVNISAGRYAKGFLAKWFGTNSADKRDELVESYFG